MCRCQIDGLSSVFWLYPQGITQHHAACSPAGGYSRPRALKNIALVCNRSALKCSRQPEETLPTAFSVRKRLPWSMSLKGLILPAMYACRYVCSQTRPPKNSFPRHIDWSSHQVQRDHSLLLVYVTGSSANPASRAQKVHRQGPMIFGL